MEDAPLHSARPGTAGVLPSPNYAKTSQRSEALNFQECVRPVCFGDGARVSDDAFDAELPRGCRNEARTPTVRRSNPNQPDCDALKGAALEHTHGFVDWPTL